MENETQTQDGQFRPRLSPTDSLLCVRLVLEVGEDIADTMVKMRMSPCRGADSLPGEKQTGLWFPNSMYLSNIGEKDSNAWYLSDKV